MKLLLALQFWDGDKTMAMKLARLIADIQPGFCQNADFLFVSRFDCAHDAEAVQHVSSKFNVHTFINSRRQATGWPWGPNELWFGTMDWIYDQTTSKLLPEYKAVLTFEADACPLNPNWINALSNEWDEKKVKVLGALQSAPGPHINGNALFSLDMTFLHWIARTVGGCSPHAGWDYALAPHFQQRGWSNTPLITSHWQTKTIVEPGVDLLFRQGSVFHHGVKDESLQKIIRARYTAR